jgi:hypothetical protein
MVTDAEVSIDKSRARLTKGTAALQAMIRSPKDAVFDTVSTTPSTPEENPNKDTRKLVVRLQGKVTKAQIEVTFRAN